MSEKDSNTLPWTVMSHSVTETRKIADILTRLILPSAVVLLSGDLGSGKTTLIQAIAASLGYRGAVKSPTFDLVHVYECDAVRIYHVDLYRVQSADELSVLDLPYAGEDRTLVLAEWGDMLAPWYPDHFHLTCESCGSLCRRFRLDAQGEAYYRRWEKWLGSSETIEKEIGH